MKNLKKLSAAFMLAALFSSSLTSCIDNEVSPVVEAIYENQAELLAAQAAVQNAEATLILAQAAAEDAATAKLEAITADFIATSAQDLIAQIAATELAVEEARIAMLLAQAEFDQDLEIILAAIRTAQNLEAGAHAADYALAMGQITTLKGEKLTAQKSIATKSLYMQSIAAGAEMTWETYLAGLESDILAKEASVLANEAFIVRANAYLDGDYADMVDALAVATAAQTAKQAEINALIAERGMVDDIATTTVNEASGILGDIDTEYTAFKAAYTNLVGELDTYKSTKEGLEDDIETLIDVTIPGLEAVIADYDGITGTLEDAVAAVELKIGARSDNSHSTNHPDGFGLLGDLETLEDALGTATTSGGEIDPVVTLYDALYNAELVAAKTAQDVVDMKAEFDLLTATYNAAATAYEAAQVAFDGQTYTADLATANDDLTDADADVVTALSTYTIAEAAFSADPTGSTTNEGADAVYTTQVNDLDELGIHSDDDVADVLTNKTYMRVKQWAPVALGSPNFVPSEFYPTQYQIADLAASNSLLTAVAALQLLPANTIVDATGDYSLGVYDLSFGDNSFIIWEQNGDWRNVANTNSGSGRFFASAGFELDVVAQTASNNNIEVVTYVEVEADDTSVKKLATFNFATNMLGLNDFTTLETGSAPTGVDAFASALTFSDDDAGYDNTWNGLGVMPAANTLTVYAAAWNAKLEQVKKQWAFDNGGTDLATKKGLYEDLKELFDNGVGNIADLQLLDDAADDLVDDAGDNITDNTDAAAAINAQLGSVDYSTRAFTTITPTHLTLSFDVHANDGLATGEEMYSIDANAGWDSDTTAGADALTVYAELWNAENALAIHADTDLDGPTGYNQQLVDANASVASKTLLVAENVILIARWQADVDALTAEYDALMATPLFAALQVRVLEIADEIAVLGAEKLVLDAEVSALVITVSFEGLATTGAIDTAINTAQGIIDGAPALIDIIEAQIASGEVSVANLATEIAALTAELSDIDAEIAVRVIEADGYLALLNAALGN